MSVPSQLCILVAGMRTRKHWEGSAREACDRQHRALWAYRALRDGFFWGGSLWKPWGVSLQEPRGSILASSHTVRTKAQRQEGAWCDPRMGGKPVEAGPGGREGTQQEGPQSNGEKGDDQTAGKPTDPPWREGGDQQHGHFTYLYFTVYTEEEPQRFTSLSGYTQGSFIRNQKYHQKGILKLSIIWVREQTFQRWG